MKRSKKMLTAMLAVTMLCTVVPFSSMATPTLAAAAAAGAEEMEWGTMEIGGGGFVSGIITGKEVMYARTDVGGAYRYNYETETWEQLLDFLSDAERGFLSVDAICIDPSDDNTVYMLCGCAYFSDARTVIYKSTDGGKSFAEIDVTDLIQVHGNGYGRQCGESIAVDPDNPDIVYCGGDVTASESALIWSQDGGQTWEPVKGYDDLGYYKYTVNWPHWANHPVRAATTQDGQAYNEQNGVSAIAIHDGKVYVGTSVIGEVNVVVADVGSDDFQPVSADLPTSHYPSRFCKDGNGNLMITYLDSIKLNKGTGGIYKYHFESGTVTDISPSTDSYGGISADPSNPDRLIASTCADAPTSQLWYENAWEDTNVAWGERFFKSEDGGASWEEITPGNRKYWEGPLMADYLQDGGRAWIRNKSIHWAGSAMIDPRNSDRFFVTSGNGVFVCDQIWSELPQYTFHPDGIEEVVALDMVSVPGGAAYSAIGDYDGFIHSDVDETGIQYQPNMGSTSAIAYCPSNPDVMVRIAERNNDTGSGFYSTDAGKTWTKMACATSGKAAITQLADGSYRIFHGVKNGVRYSDDMGQTWEALTISGMYYECTPYPFVDPENPQNVYVYGYSKAANEYDTTPTRYKLYTSTDYGTTFSAPVDIATYDGCDAATRIAYLGDGKLALAAGWYGLYTVDSGVITSKDVFYCKTLGYGAPEKTGGVNTLYLYGQPTETDKEGIYRSTDGGDSWVAINTDRTYGGTGNGNFLVGDMNTFGTVYMSTVGMGIVYGRISDSTEENPIKYGDVNVDGTISVSDIILLARYMAEDTTIVITEQGIRNADCDVDGLTTTSDLTMIANYMAHLIPLSDLGKAK